jgi:hypothetical protein
MRALKLVGLGIALWGLSLLWPEVNWALTPPVMMGLVLGLGAAALAYVVSQRLDGRHNGDGAGQDHPTRPIPVVVVR